MQEITYYLHNVLTNKDLGAMPNKLHILITLRGVHHSLRVVLLVLQDLVVYNFIPERYSVLNNLHNNSHDLKMQTIQGVTTQSISHYSLGKKLNLVDCLPQLRYWVRGGPDLICLLRVAIRRGLLLDCSFPRVKDNLLLGMRVAPGLHKLSRGLKYIKGAGVTKGLVKVVQHL